MKYMLDTNICIELLRKSNRRILEHIKQYDIGDIGISSITLAELQYGVEKSTKQPQNQNILTAFLADLEVVDFDSNAAIYYGQIRTHLETKGTLVGPMNTLLAAHALALDVTFVTNNKREFKRIKSLKVENWTRS